MRIAAEKKRKQDEERPKKHEEDPSCKQPYCKVWSNGPLSAYGNGSKSFDLNPNKNSCTVV